jgi:hypothetical protein
VPVVHNHSDIPPLWIHDLTGTDIVGKLLDFGEEAIENGKITLSRMRSLNPEMARSFAIKSSSAVHVPFKLLSDIGQAHETYNKGNDSSTAHLFNKFIAVSYCWRDESWKTAESCRLPKPPVLWPIPISPRTLKVILNLRISREVGVWIDQLCINQGNSVERMQAIHSMDAVYRSADGVAILWEDADLTSEEEDILHTLSVVWEKKGNLRNLTRHSIDGNFHLLTESDLAHLETLLSKLFSCRWLSRAWCYHEYLLNPRTVIVIPGSAGSEIVLRTVAFDYLFQIMVKLDKAPTTVPECATFSHHIDENDTNILTRSKYVLLYEACWRSCSNLEDKVTLGLNITNIGLNFLGGVESEDECRWILALALLCSGDATTLSVTEGTPISRPADMFSTQSLRQYSNKMIYSWLEWPTGYRYLSPTCPGLSKPRILNYGSISHIGFQSVTLDMLVLLSMPRRPLQDSIARAASFIGHCETFFPEILNNINDSWGIKKRPNGSLIAEIHSSSREQILNYIACGLDNGVDWIAGAFRFLGRNEKLDTTFDGINDTKQLLPVATHHLFHDYDQPLDLEHEDGILRFLTVSLDPWNYRTMGGIPYTVSLDSGAGKWIIVAPQLIRHELQIAIPASLTDSSCSGINRAWQLKEHYSNSSKGYIVTQKCAISGCGDIKGNEKTLVLSRNIRIFGQSKAAL